MEFRTQVPIFPHHNLINHQTPVMLMGSCFTENIGHLLQRYKFNTAINPFGILFNPFSICHSLHKIIRNEQYTEDQLFYHNERWHSFDHHSEFSGMDKNACLDNINLSIETSHYFLTKARFLVITFGTAFAYYKKPDYQVVANCHKVEANRFVRKMLTVEEITAWFRELFYQLQFFNPDLEIILTVSPVRHIKDGFTENNLSKATLLLAVNNLVSEFKQAHYFPAYEIVLDELRDYRFFKEDMVHPNELAVKYVWEKFGEMYFDESTQLLNDKIERILQASEHKPFNASSESHQQFNKVQLEKIRILEQENIFLDFKNEKTIFNHK